jgi:hypothetical protein
MIELFITTAMRTSNPTTNALFIVVYINLFRPYQDKDYLDIMDPTESIPIVLSDDGSSYRNIIYCGV